MRLRCALGYGGRSDKSSLGYKPARFQVVWDLPPHAKHAPEGKTLEDVKMNWLGQVAVDFSRAEHAEVEGWRSPLKERKLGILP